MHQNEKMRRRQPAEVACGAGSISHRKLVLDVLSSQTPAAIILQQQGSTLIVSASDPQRMLQTLTITINIPGYNTVTQQDSQIHVTQLSPAISFTVDVSSGTGASYSVTFSNVAGHSGVVRPR